VTLFFTGKSEIKFRKQNRLFISESSGTLVLREQWANQARNKKKTKKRKIREHYVKKTTTQMSVTASGVRK